MKAFWERLKARWRQFVKNFEDSLDVWDDD